MLFHPPIDIIGGLLPLVSLSAFEFITQPSEVAGQACRYVAYNRYRCRYAWSMQSRTWRAPGCVEPPCAHAYDRGLVPASAVLNTTFTTHL
jgi:hypothetical protein